MRGRICRLLGHALVHWPDRDGVTNFDRYICRRCSRAFRHDPDPEAVR